MQFELNALNCIARQIVSSFTIFFIVKKIEVKFPKQTLLLINARSVLRKFDELRVLHSVHHSSIIVVAESWLNPDIHSDLLHLRNYHLFRDDRVTRIGGGVCAWIHQSLCPRLIPSAKYSSFDCLFVHLMAAQILLVSVYFPPRISAAEKLLIDSVISNKIDSHLIDYPDSDIIICGDFNKFSTINLEVTFDLTNLVTAPTRRNNILDKIFVSSDLAPLFHKCEVLPPLSTSDHNCVYVRGSKSDNQYTHHLQFQRLSTVKSWTTDL